MRDAIWSAEKGNLRLEIHYDAVSEDPRQWDNLGTMVCFHKRYSLGDKHEYTEYTEFLKSDEYKNAALVLPLYLYDHSGITMNTTGFACPWDSGQVGWIYVTREKVKEEYSRKRMSKKLLEHVKTVLLSEVRVYDEYISGQVYGFKTFKKTDLEDDFDDADEVDSCWGFFGSDWMENGLHEQLPEEFKPLVKELT